MVDKNELRASFSARLHEALDAAGVRSRGRGVDVHRQLKRAGVQRTPQAVSKWLNGEAVAESDSIAALCSWLNIRREWLEYGVLPKNPLTKAREVATYGANETISHSQQVPLISWLQASLRCKHADADAHEIAQWIYCPVPISQSGYALNVIGDSMTSASSERSYPAGCIIFVEPRIEARPGDRVIARVPRTDEVTFKTLVTDAGRQFLRPLNPQYPIIDITEETHICGKVIGSFIPE